MPTLIKHKCFTLRRWERTSRSQAGLRYGWESSSLRVYCCGRVATLMFTRKISSSPTSTKTLTAWSSSPKRPIPKSPFLPWPLLSLNGSLTWDKSPPTNWSRTRFCWATSQIKPRTSTKTSSRKIKFNKSPVNNYSPISNHAMNFTPILESTCRVFTRLPPGTPPTNISICAFRPLSSVLPATTWRPCPKL